jgi:hypothetical protein
MVFVKTSMVAQEATETQEVAATTSFGKVSGLPYTLAGNDEYGREVWLDTNGRRVLYPKREVMLCVNKELENGEDPTAIGNGPLTVPQVEYLIGWEQEPADDKFGNDFLLKDMNGVKIRCSNNVNNRPLYFEQYSRHSQEVLNRKWRFNGETIIISKYGTVLNGQHQMVGLKLAEQTRTSADDKTRNHWAKYWQEPVYIEKTVVFGVEEDDDTVNTMDTCKPRSVADILYRSPYFADQNKTKRKIMSKMVEFAIRLLWDRTGASKNAFVPKQTNTESLDFLNRHPRLLEAVIHIDRENGGEDKGKDGGKQRLLGEYISLGYASAALYLMGTAASNPREYHQKLLLTGDPSEKDLDFSTWDLACNFWTMLASPYRKTMNDLRYVLGQLGHGAALKNRLAILAKAWQLILDDPDYWPTQADLILEMSPNENGVIVLRENPTFGGIDIGVTRGPMAGTVANELLDKIPPGASPKEVEQAKQEVKEARAAELRRKHIEREEARAKKHAQQALDAAKAGEDSIAKVSRLDMVDAARVGHEGNLLLFKGGDEKGKEVWTAYADDAKILNQVTKRKLAKKQKDGVDRVNVSEAELDSVLSGLIASGYKPLLVVETSRGFHYINCEITEPEVDDPNPQELDNGEIHEPSEQELESSKVHTKGKRSTDPAVVAEGTRG